MAKSESEVKTGDAAVDRLYKAVANYVKKRGGSTAVIGGIQIQEWPGDKKFQFTVAVKCTGRKPEFTSPSERETR